MEPEDKIVFAYLLPVLGALAAVVALFVPNTTLSSMLPYITGTVILWTFLVGAVIIIFTGFALEDSNSSILPSIIVVTGIVWVLTVLFLAVHMTDECSTVSNTITMDNQEYIVTFSSCRDRPYLYGPYSDPIRSNILTIVPKDELE